MAELLEILDIKDLLIEENIISILEIFILL